MADRESTTADEFDAHASFVDLVLEVGRQIRVWRPADPRSVVLTPTERSVMRLVDTHPGSSPSELADHGRLQRSNLSATLGMLEQKGMIRRVRNSGRNVRVEPTDLAQANLRLLRAAWSDNMQRLLPDESVVADANEALRRIEAALRARTEDDAPGRDGSK